MYYKCFKYMPKEKLKIDTAYLCVARNFEIGIWNGKDFDYMRYKWGTVFSDKELHYDEGAPHGTVQPILEIKKDKNNCTFCNEDAFLLDKNKDMWYCLECYLKNYRTNGEDVLNIMM